MKKDQNSVGTALRVLFTYPGTVFFTALASVVALLAILAAGADVEPRQVRTLVLTAVLILLLVVPACLAVEQMVGGDGDLGGPPGDGEARGEQ